MSQRVNDECAQDAYKLIADVSKENNKIANDDERKKENKAFRSIARSFPTKVQTNGLLVAVAFLDTKDAQHGKLKVALEAWVEKKNLIKSKNLTKELVKLDRDKYRLASQEVMAYAQWVKRFAEGRWDKDGEEKK